MSSSKMVRLLLTPALVTGALIVLIPTASATPYGVKTIVVPVAVKHQIAKSYNTVFDLANGSKAKKLADIQDGATLREALTGVLSFSLAASATGATVSMAIQLSTTQCHAAKVTPPCARVVYSILGPNGQILIANSNGYAIHTNSRWLVAKTTICGLFGLFYQAEGDTNPVPGCPS